MTEKLLATVPPLAVLGVCLSRLVTCGSQVLLLTAAAASAFCPCVVDAPDVLCGDVGLASLPDCVLRAKASSSLTALHFGGNSVTHLTNADAFGRLPALTTLRLYDNGLDTLWGSAFQKLPNLRTLDLHGNQLNFLHEDLFNWTISLVFLDLSDNRIAGFHKDVFRPLEVLQELDLSGNLLTSVPTLWSPSLQALDASGNRLSCVHLAEALLRASASLLRLDVSGNELRRLDLREPLLPRLRDLRLDSNPWQCDCALAPLQRLVAARNASGADDDAEALCGLPPELHGDAMLATVAAMTCDQAEADAGGDAGETATPSPAGHARKALAVTGVTVAVVVLGVIASALGVAGLHRLRRRNVELRLAEEAALGVELKPYR